MEPVLQKTFHILFVDDDTDESYLFNEALEQSGLPIRLSRAHDGNQLIKVLQSEKLPDIVLTDINMPYKDGIEALEEIRSNAEFDNVRIVIYSITANKANIENAYQKGADLYLVKPSDFNGMLKAVKTIYNIDWHLYSRPSINDFVINLNH